MQSCVQRLQQHQVVNICFSQNLYFFDWLNGLPQEHQKFKQFTDSLLARASKISEMIGSLETALTEAGKDSESPEGKRVARPTTQGIIPKQYLMLDHPVQELTPNAFPTLSPQPGYSGKWHCLKPQAKSWRTILRSARQWRCKRRAWGTSKQQNARTRSTSTYGQGLTTYCSFILLLSQP